MSNRIFAEVDIIARVGAAAVPHLLAGLTKSEALALACADVAHQCNSDPESVAAAYADAAIKRSSDE